MSRRMRRRAERRHVKDGFYIVAPSIEELDAWEDRLRNDPTLDNDDRAVGLAIAKLLRAAS